MSTHEDVVCVLMALYFRDPYPWTIRGVWATIMETATACTIFEGEEEYDQLSHIIQSCSRPSDMDMDRTRVNGGPAPKQPRWNHRRTFTHL